MIRFESFGKSYGTLKAIDSLTLEVRAGEVMVLLGPNGSGKTTSLKAAAGLLRPGSGQVRVGEPGLPSMLAEARRAISFLPQKVAFPEALTGSEVLEFYRRLRGQSEARAQAVQRLSALDGAMQRAVGTYSGGMTQRLGLAVAALPEVPVLLLDEPSSALDPDGLCAFYGLVEQRRREGRTVLFSSHQLGDVEQLADRVAVLVAGKLAALLTAAELRERLSARGVMRVRVDACPVGLVARLANLSPGAVWTGAELIVPGSATVRAAALELIHAAGARVQGLTAEEGRIDTLYQELVGGAA
ncbi:MAG: ABC transporter ATP-binding protein [Myxococcaceae bacterium]